MKQGLGYGGNTFPIMLQQFLPSWSNLWSRIVVVKHHTIY